jgi:molybdopterin/thiamine biosynthesis adenylyltransferase/rhodanese-related sulfurtransferase
MLEKEEHRRYSRQIILPEIGLEGQLKLKSAKVLIIGAGGLGCPILQYLTAAGIGEIGIIDDDEVDVTNLHRQILYSAEDVGKPKAAVAKVKLQHLNPHVKVTALVERLTSDNASNIIAEYQLIIDGSDNFETRYLVNDTCVSLNKTLVFGSIFKFEGQVSVFNLFHGPNYRDIFPEPPASNEVPNCADIGVLGILPGLVGLYMANEAIKIICEVGETLSGKLMTISALDNSTNYFTIAKRSEPSVIAFKRKPDAIAEINRETLDQWLLNDDKQVMIVDVREAYEFEESNIGGVNIPLYELQSQVDSLPYSSTIVFVCHTGQRSKMAVQLLKGQYKGDVYHLKNGFG